MKTKLDVNGIEVYTIESKEDCIIALNNLKNDFSGNNHMYDFIAQIDDSIKALGENYFAAVLNIKRKTSCKSLNRILHVFEKDCLYNLYNQ